VTSFPPIAVVGRACLLPGVSSPEELWTAVLEGRDLVSGVPHDRWGIEPADVLCDGPTDSADRTWSDRGGYVRGFDALFDPTGFALPADEIGSLDPVFTWTLHTARAALRDAGHDGADPQRFGAVFGNLSFPSAGMAAFVEATTIADVAGYGTEALDAAGIAPVDPRNRFTSGLPALLLERALGLGAGAYALDAACASSLYAIKLACDRLHDGDADLMLAGAVNCADDLCIHLGFSALTALSRTGRSRPFHAEADGLVPAEGCAFVALRRLDDAVRDGDTVHGIIRGVGLSNDGRGRGMLVPSQEGQRRAMTAALDIAGLDATDVSLLECHATGTAVGDATEIRSSAEVYGACVDLPIGSLKSNTGHLITAAGVAGLIKVLEAMAHETRPPTISVDEPLAEIEASPFRLLTAAEPWDRTEVRDGVLRAAVSAFGFGGNNAHLIVEEPSAVELGTASTQPAVASPVPIAIVGIGVVAASAVGRHAFADALLSDTSCLDEDGLGTMPAISLDLAEQRFPPNDLDKTLAQQLAMMQVTHEAVADCGTVRPASTGVYVGMGTDAEAARFGVRWRLATRGAAWGQSAEWIAEARDHVGPVLDAPAVLGTMPNIVANRLNSQFDFAGPSFTVSSEEHSGLDALRIATRALATGELDAAVVGAVDLSCELVHRSAVGACLDDSRQVPGDAAVAMVLKRLDDAERDGDTVYAVLPGGRYDEHGARDEDRPDLLLGLGGRAESVTRLFGHAHAAGGLVHIAAAAILLHHRVGIGDVPLLASNPASGSGLSEGAGPRTIGVAIDAMDGIATRSVLLAEASRHRAPSRIAAPRLHVFSGADAAAVLESLDAGIESDDGPARLVIVADGDGQLRERAERARRHIEHGHPAGEGVRFRPEPLDGELAFLYTAAGAAYAGMGAQLLRALPEAADRVAESFPLGETASWVFGDAGHEPTPSDFLWGTSLVSSSHTHITRHLLGLRPTAAIGYSSGESNSLFAFGIWSDRAAMRDEIEASGMMDRELGVDFAAVARAWGELSASWAMWNVLAPVGDVRDAIAGEERVHLAIINTANDTVIGGDREACERVVDVLGRRRCRPVAYNLACHVPEVRQAFHRPWLDIHTRVVTPMPGVRHYSNGVNGAYEVSTAACAEVITRQAEQTLDFPATIEAAYADGVRIFVEHGPAGACTNFITQVLGDRDHLAIPLDRRDKNIEQLFEVAAALVAAGVEVDHQALSARLACPGRAPEEAATNRHRSFAAHPAPSALPPRCTPTGSPTPLERDDMARQYMPPAPSRPPVTANGAVASNGAVAPAALPPPVEPAELSAADIVAGEIHAQMLQIAGLHEAFVAQRAALHDQFLAGSVADLRSLASTDATPALGQPARGPGNVFWDKRQLEIHSSGTISELFGPLFAPQDERVIQCRMPEPPLLLADRVTGIDATPGLLGTGTIWTETDVVAGAWYLNDGFMPTGFMIEAGQADLMLISYMGIDLITEPDRAYRLLGCTLTYHGDLPSPGDTLAYEIRITGHAKHGDVRLFFFEYDCLVDGERRLTVRDGQAGFFTPQELADALGVLWTPEAAAGDLDPDARVDAPAIASPKSSFSRDEVVAFSEGRLVDCFGPAYSWAHTHTRTPKIQSGAQLFIDEVTVFDPTGGPWGRGFMRCETAIADDAWFFDGHFKNDPCMPGNFMVEACIEALSFYLAAMGFTTQRDGWRFQPLPGQPFDLKCRGEINPRTERVAYEVHVEELWNGPHPTVIADVVGYVDGRAAFHAHRIAVELTPSWPLTSMSELYEGVVEPVAVATDAEGFPFDWKAMISCAWGRPSEAFGSMYRVFDGTRRSPRLPGPPYHFISRITRIDGDLGVCAPGMKIVCEYDIPDDAWYFDANGAEIMPFAVLLEAALQPCGWVASAVGSATAMDDDMLFRNLDGTGTLTSELTRTAGTLTTHVELISVSRAGGMVIEAFEVECFLGDRSVYTMTTVFGFFPPEAFDNQVGLAIRDEHSVPLELAAPPMVDLTGRPDPYVAGSARLAEPMLLMLDRAVHVAGAGRAGLGVVRGEKDVDVTEWFFKAHFFQDPVQPGSLGIEALLQLLQFFMLDTGMDEGLVDASFEPLMIGTPLTWSYRGQVTPANTRITTVMEITEIGSDERGRFVIGTGSLWCDGIRIYEVKNMGMRLVGGIAAPDALAAPATCTEIDRSAARAAMRRYWPQHRGTGEAWLGADLLDGMFDRYVGRVVTERPDTLERLRGRPAIYLANHQVQVESLLISNLLPALTGVAMTTVANAKHESRWIGELVRLFDAYPGATAVDQIAYFDQSDPGSMFELIDRVRQALVTGSHSFFVHADGTRSQSCRRPTTRCSSVFIDMALELGLPIVPVRFTGGLPVEPITGKAEFPDGHAAQDYWIGEPIEAETLQAMTLRDRVEHVVSAINDLGVPNSVEQPNAPDPAFAAKVADRQWRTGVHEVHAAAWEILLDCPSPSAETQLLLRHESSGLDPDAAPLGPWLGAVAELLLGSDGELVVVNRDTHPHLADHAVGGTPVVPVAYAVEWFARDAQTSFGPGRSFALCDVQVLNGVVADGFHDGSDLELRVQASTENGHRHRLELVDSTGRRRYRCDVVALDGDDPSPPVLAGPATELRSIYDDGGVLFHGPAFRVLDDVRLYPGTGLTASVRGVAGASWPDVRWGTDGGVVGHGWPAEPWRTDPGVIDGALQLALLWSEHVVGGASLPTSIGLVRVLDRPRPGPMWATLVGRGATNAKVRSDVVVGDAEGAVVAVLEGVETHALGRSGRPMP
jgi:acyl transferase domain-containing protein/3-hydroxymyristoyl/3-hydroxydecanoyl-(acyl carrier protein) dehydratase/1-acyl-sn-glycerol-3-phosphate acyltransferase